MESFTAEKIEHKSQMLLKAFSRGPCAFQLQFG